MSSPSRPRAGWDDAPPKQRARTYYAATTWIYRWAWGSSFHFAPLVAGRSRRAAIAAYESRIADCLEVAPGATVLDLGCGIGGPAQAVAARTGARVVAINATPEQLLAMPRRWRQPEGRIAPIGGDFQALPLATAVADGAFAFEALCHAVDLGATFREVRRVLRPGAVLCFSDWCLTASFDPGNREHMDLRRTIESSYGVVRLRSHAEWRQGLAEAGFVIERLADAAGDEAEPWYRALQPRDRSLDGLARASWSRTLQESLLRIAERLVLAPPGTGSAVRCLRAGTVALVRAGELGIFTPMLFARCHNPDVG